MTTSDKPSTTLKTVLLLLCTLTTMSILLFSLLPHIRHAPWHTPRSIMVLAQNTPPPPTPFLREQVSKGAAVGRPHCILYDRPPRTGSTTIGTTLETCLRRRGYALLSTKGTARTRANVVPRLTALAARRTHVASVRQHVYTHPGQLRRLRAACGRLLLVTSTAPMLPRLLSMVKYSTFEGHRNATVPATILAAELLRKGTKLRKREAFFEAYPYVEHEQELEQEHTAARNSSDSLRLTPHYVVTRQHLARDLRALLAALHCPTLPIETRNVHVVRYALGEGRREAREAMEQAGEMVGMGDRQYREMMALARERNRAGLQLARTF